MMGKRDNKTNGYTKGIEVEAEIDVPDVVAELDEEQVAEIGRSIIGAYEIVSLEVPLTEEDPDIQPTTTLQCRLYADEAMVVRRLRDALYMQHARRADGRHVESIADAVRWLIGRAGGLIPAE